MHLTCATCGGILPPEAARAPATCRFCGATSVPPPTVVEHVVLERVVVERFRGYVPPPEPETPRLPCPRCADYLNEKRVGAAQLAGCRSCGGVWLDAATVERLKRAHDDELERAARSINGVVSDIGGPPDQNMSIACPVCSTHLRRVPIPGTTSSVDVCDAHGTWFDRAHGDELQMFVTAF